MKKRILSLLTAALVLLLIPLSWLWALFAVEPQYDETYYGELSALYQQLKDAEGNRLILIGGSAVAFGVNVSLLQEEIDGYTVCPFGLYGAVGTKAMLELARDELREGDVVVVMPEISAHSMSLYFSADELWKCADSDLSIALAMDGDDAGCMLANLPTYLTAKLTYAREGKPTGEGVYTKSAFDGEGQLVYDRPYNIMAGLYDSDNLISFSTDLLDAEFIDHLNEYYEYCYWQGVSLYYAFCPVNRMAVTGDADLAAFYNALNDSLRFPILGSLEDALMDAEWFYDSNYHLNTAGSQVYTAALAAAVKPVLGDTSPTLFEEPEKPVAPVTDAEGDNSDADCFTYEIVNNTVNLTGRTEAGLRRTRLVLPTSYEGLPVVSFDAELFQGDVYLEELVLSSTLRTIHNESFFGCTSLTRIVLTSETPVCSVGDQLLAGCQSATIYAPNRESYLSYLVNYYWSQFAGRLSYEGAE